MDQHSTRDPRLPPEVMGFAAAALVAFLGIAVIGPKVLGARRATAAGVAALRRKAELARRDADRAAARARDALREAGERAQAAGRRTREAGTRAGSDAAQAAAHAAGDAAGEVAARAQKRLRRLGGGTIRAKWS